MGQTPGVICLEAAHEKITHDECHGRVSARLKADLEVRLDCYVTTHRQALIAAVKNWWDKYRVPLSEIEMERDAAAVRLEDFWKELAYVSEVNLGTTRV